jgi:protein-S-isoprenylcysteine O-methyltransferase Ste14
MERLMPYLVGVLGVTVLLAFVLAPMSVFAPPSTLAIAAGVVVALVGLLGFAIRMYTNGRFE